jgi:hypothetical protein
MDCFKTMMSENIKNKFNLSLENYSLINQIVKNKGK